MGKTARKIVRARVEQICSDLNKAYADEWLAHYMYWLCGELIRGIDADTLKQELIKQSMDELGHAGKLARRIIQLGGTPVLNPGRLIESSGCGYLEPPSDPTDLRAVINNVLKAEECAINFYNSMVAKYRTTDVLTHEIFEELLEDEVDDEETWERFAAKL